jgi:hypothetical protein
MLKLVQSITNRLLVDTISSVFPVVVAVTVPGVFLTVGTVPLGMLFTPSNDGRGGNAAALPARKTRAATQKLL